MKTKKRVQGMTLLELIVAIAIFGIVSITFLPVFFSGFKNLSSAGSKSRAQYNTQQALENNLSGSAASFQNIVATELQTNLQISFGVNNISINGKTLNFNYSDGKNSLTLTVFKPD